MADRDNAEAAVSALIAKQGVVDSITPTNLAIEQLRVIVESALMIDEGVEAGRGGIGVNAAAGLSDIDATPQVLTGFDTEVITDTRGVTQVLANNGLILDLNGVWQVSAKVTLSFAEANQGREIRLQLYNATDDVAGDDFVYFVGRNQGGVNLAFTIPFEVPIATVGDLIQLRVFSPADTFTTVQNIGTFFTMVHVSESQA